ncbi:SDR family oxidoreductase [Staphylospora marina]|uniref:SDR family oxidoreductase n=1 Tax=Staphylospora marina TaxID=2490858 RepID=UPI000F5C1617|nr:SDR family oxidoreductase [Staphylospora marina]
METRVAWIVGGVKGLGVQVARALAEDGFRIVLNYRKSVEAGHKWKERIEKIHGECLLLQGDVADGEDVRRMANEVMSAWGRVDVLVCAAGPFTFRPKRLTEFDDDTWREMVDGNLSGVFRLIREVVPGMRERRFGRIITFGYAEVEQMGGWEGYGPYAAAKTGLLSLTRTLAREEAPHGITVNMVVPGDIRDPFKEAQIADVRGHTDPRTPAGRPGTGEDIARVVRFLAHPDSDLITGAVIPVTGGFTHWLYHVK